MKTEILTKSGDVYVELESLNGNLVVSKSVRPVLLSHTVNTFNGAGPFEISDKIATYGFNAFILQVNVKSDSADTLGFPNSNVTFPSLYYPSSINGPSGFIPDLIVEDNGGTICATYGTNFSQNVAIKELTFYTQLVTQSGNFDNMVITVDIYGI